MQTTVYQFNDAIDFLGYAFAQRKAKNPGFSIRAWARSAGSVSPAMLSQTLNRKRVLSVEIASKLRDWAIKDTQEKRYFDALVFLSRAKSPQEREIFQSILDGLRPQKNQNQMVEIDQLKYFSSWYYFAIRELTQIEDFQEDPKWIAGRLKGTLRAVDVPEIIETLVRLNLLRRESNGKLIHTGEVLVTRSGQPSLSMREVHAQLLDLAKDALTESLDRRDLSFVCVTSSMQKVALAKKAIEKFRADLIDLLNEPSGDELIQVNFQLFNLLRPNFKEFSK